MMSEASKLRQPSSSASLREAEVRRHAGLVMSVARRFAGRAEIADLYQAGCVGLLRAIDRYEPSRGTAFSTFAVPIILSEILGYVRAQVLCTCLARCGSLHRSAGARRTRSVLSSPVSPKQLKSPHLGVDVADVSWQWSPRRMSLRFSTR